MTSVRLAGDHGRMRGRVKDSQQEEHPKGQIWGGKGPVGSMILKRNRREKARATVFGEVVWFIYCNSNMNQIVRNLAINR